MLRRWPQWPDRITRAARGSQGPCTAALEVSPGVNMSRPAQHLGLVATLLITCVFTLTGCTRTRVELRQGDLPANAHSLLGEARAFKAEGPAGSHGKAVTSLESVRAKFGNFETAHVLAYDSSGKPAGMIQA